MLGAERISGKATHMEQSRLRLPFGRHFDVAHVSVISPVD